MEITFNKKIYNLPERIAKRLKQGVKFIDKRTGEIFTGIAVLDEHCANLLNKYFDTVRWDINVRQDSYSNVPGYKQEAKAKKKELITEMREVERFLIDFLGEEYRGVAKTCILLENSTGGQCIIGDNVMRKYIKEAKDESRVNN